MNPRMHRTKLELLAFLILPMVWLVGCDNRPSAPSRDASAGPHASSKTQVVPIPNMVLIKAGNLTRGRHAVTISRDFWLAKYEVTQAEYEGLMGRNPSQFKGDTNRPVEKVSYQDATQYCAGLSLRERGAGRLPVGFEYRLPSEAEWEYACRANTTNRFSFGEKITEAARYAWTAENSEAMTHPVGQKQPNPWGLYDMHGNVWEWCLDWFAEYPAADAVDPAGPPGGKFKLFRGGGWNQDAEFARSANRFMMAPTSGIYFVGFRVALGHTRQ